MYVRIMEPQEALAVEDALDDSYRRQCAELRRELAAIAELDRAEAYRVDGALSMPDWLSFKYGYSEHTARAKTKAAHALEFLPAIGDALEWGLLPWDKVRWLVEFATPDEDESLAADAVGLSYTQVRDIALHRRRMARVAAEARHRRRYLKIVRDVEEGVVHFWGRLSDADGETFKAAVERIADTAPRDAMTGGLEPFAQRCADALVQMSSLALGADPDPDRANVVVHTDAAALASEDGVATMQGGMVIAADTARRLSCDARVQVIVHDPAGEEIGASKMTRTVPTHLRRQLIARDRGCIVEGCSNTRWLHAHHEVHYAHGGRTTASNLVMVCGKHHRWLHEGGGSLQHLPNGKADLVLPRPAPQLGSRAAAARGP